MYKAMLNNKFQLFLVCACLLLPCAANALNNEIHYKLNICENSEHGCLNISLKSKINEEGKFVIRFPVGAKTFKVRTLSQNITLSDATTSSEKVINGTKGDEFEVIYDFF